MEGGTVDFDSVDIPPDFINIPPMKFCRDRIADVSVQNDTYVFDVSEVNGIFYIFNLCFLCYLNLF